MLSSEIEAYTLAESANSQFASPAQTCAIIGIPRAGMSYHMLG